VSAPQAGFARSYGEARRKFLDAAAAAGLPVDSRPYPCAGLEGEPLALDVARDGPPEARNLLVLTSACHGVEGFCGSGIQVAALGDAALRARAAAAGVALLHVHALNPYGFSHFGRTTHENVDLNRNFHDFARPLPVNADYRELHPILVPREWPPEPENTHQVLRYVAERGEKHYQAVISRGQHEFVDGLFYGGRAPTWSNLALREVLRAHARRAARIAWIDLHTGLGPSGVGERIFACRDDAAALARARSWWGGGGRTPVTSIYDGSSTSASSPADVHGPVRGMPAGGIHRNRAGVRDGAGDGHLPGAARRTVAAPPSGSAAGAGGRDPAAGVRGGLHRHGPVARAGGGAGARGIGAGDRRAGLVGWGERGAV